MIYSVDFEQPEPVLFRAEVVIHVLVFADKVNEVSGERSFLVGKSWSLITAQKC